jgi:hypothetical protein
VDPDVLRPLLAAIGPAVVLAASVSWPLIALGVAAVTALALWGLFRRGSIADRARADYDDDPEPGASGPTRG